MITDEELDRIAVFPREKLIGVGGAVAFASYLTMEFAAKAETWPVFVEFLRTYDHPMIRLWTEKYLNKSDARGELIDHASHLQDACDILAGIWFEE